MNDAVSQEHRRARPVRRLVLLTALAAVLSIALASTARASGGWSGAGTGTTSVIDDGSSGNPAQFQYSDNWSGGWSFSTTAAADGVVDLEYTYSGYHAWFQVQVGLDAYVTSGGVTTTIPLVHAGPVNCCTSPSGGFTYTGTVQLYVVAGATYGFQLSGSNGDSDSRLLGTLTVRDTTPRADRAAYCSVTGDTWPDTGLPMAVGTFLDLLAGQPATDPSYLGATPAIFVDGLGLTCDPPPSGYTRDGFASDTQVVDAGIYRFYRRLR